MTVWFGASYHFLPMMRPSTLDDLVRRAAALAREDRRVVLGITGCPGAGKSTLSTWIVQALRPHAGELPMDGFHLADSALARLGRQNRKGAIDTFDAHGYLTALRRARAETGSTVYAPNFDRGTEQPVAGSIAIDPEVRLVVTEGNYLLMPQAPWLEVRSELAEVWYVHLDDELRRQQLVARHVRFGKSEAAAWRWVKAVDEVNARLIAATRETADLLVDMAAINPPSSASPPEAKATRRAAS